MTNETIDPTTEPTPLSRRKLNRRGFLGATGAVGAVAFLAACGSDDDSSSTTTAADKTTTTVAGGGTATTMPEGGDDLATGAFAASLEVLAVNTYGAALDAATANKLGPVPPAVAEFVTTAKAHHQAALDAWNDVLTGAGKEKVTKPPADLEATVNGEFGKVTDVIGAAKLALMLEEIAAATYLAAIPTLTSDPAIALASSIQPIDMQHAAVLRFVLGEYPVPDVFAKTDKAATPS
ncbi:MAG: ferritin-like domain-containing protein [Aquihabitans sp.]